MQDIVDDPRRQVTLDGVHNFRDLGGYPADDGCTRWGVVYRADGLQRLTPADVDSLRERSLAMVIDLRTETELVERGRFPVELHEVAYHHLPVLDRTWQAEDVPQFETDHEFLLWAYHDMLRVGGDKLALALDLIAHAGGSPLVFHCAAGKDRTGLLAALLLSVLGVPDEYIAADYAKTADNMPRMLAAWRAAAPEWDGRIDPDRRHYFTSPPLVMLRLLAEIREGHGSVTDFVGTLPIADDTIEALRRRLIVDG